ncbi:hypothetical protein EDD18DRAFT_1351072 [Armillaria luteobubalina]|uniref:ER-bound oxygenase mpaB/mpaB'/Rubber oxygenase catalytic domain-containing protein n=1 Tax=Armillaria luteobubalina TaxID=153913 RepID=A0AA39UPZ4_9AGAR|nr:hypothetical protein EDD18DRAFT_1351072 [Armillaria luteobubalina]
MPYFVVEPNEKFTADNDTASLTYWCQRKNTDSPTAKVYCPDKSGYKWIIRYLASLDPENDWEEMVKTFMSYNSNEFIFNIIYSAILLVVNMNPVGLTTAVDTGKLLNKKQKRFEDTRDFFLPLFEFGPTSTIHAENQRRLNALHMRLAKQYPGSWNNYDDFIEACAVAARAMYLFVKCLYEGSLTESGLAPPDSFPPDFDACVKFTEEWDRRPWPPSDMARMMGKAVCEQFEERWFPRPFHFVGRAVFCLSFGDDTLEYFGLGPRNQVVTFLVKKTMWVAFMIQTLMPDPKLGTYEKNRMRRDGVPLPQSSVKRLVMTALLATLLSVTIYHFVKTQ